MLAVDDALARLLAGLKPTETETVPLARASGRVLGEKLHALCTQPPLPVSAMDGYAVRFEDLKGPETRLAQIGEVAAGAIYSGEAQLGSCLRIFTGAAVPDGYDTVIAQEDTARDGETWVIIKTETQKGRHIRAAGLDFENGSVLMEAGCRLDPARIALAAAANRPDIHVHRRPKVGVLATGNELVRAGMEPEPGQIIASGLYGLLAAIEDWGGDAVDLGIAADDPAELKDILQHTEGLDLLITIGGASVGDHDLVQPALKEAGFALDFWKIAMRPGKPLMVARKDDLTAIGLPGNPVSSLVCALLFVRPAIAVLSGVRAPKPFYLTAHLEAPLDANGPRQDYIRTSLRREDDIWLARPHRVQDSSMLSVLAQSGGLIVRAPHAPPASTGDGVQVLLLADLGRPDTSTYACNSKKT